MSPLGLLRLLPRFFELSAHHWARKAAGAVFVTVLASAGALLIRMPPLRGVTSDADWFIYDQLWRTRAHANMRDGAVAILRVADEDLRLMNTAVQSETEARDAWGWPWPRLMWGNLVEYLAAAGARAIVFDVQFSETSVYNRLWPDDEAFAASIQQAQARRVPVVLAAKLVRDAGDAAPMLEELAGPLRSFPRGVVTVEQGTLLREYRPVVSGEPSLGLAVLRALKVDLPDWAESPFLLHWYGPSVTRDGDTFRYSSAFYHMNAANAWKAGDAEGAPVPANPATREDLARLKGRIVIIGGTSAATYDLYSTPLAKLFPGVEMHATAIENLLRAERTERTPEWAILLAIVCTAGATAMVTIFPVGLWLRLGAGFTVLGLLTGAAVIHFGGAEVDWLPLASPMVAGALGTIGGFARNYLSEDARRRLMTRAMAQYVSPEVTRQIERRPDQLRLDAEQRVMTVLFSDMAGFTDFSEAAEIKVLTRVLNAYMERMSRVVLEEGGTIDKYIGDAIMAFWNAPLEQADHAARACRAALRMRQAERDVRETLLADAELTALLERAGQGSSVAASVRGLGESALYTRFGVNTGPMNVGNWGSARKFQYTVIGDAVNAAARLEPSNKRYGTRIIIAETTAELVRGAFVMRRVDLLRVKGKSRAIGVFELIAEGPGTDAQRAVVAAYDLAFERYAHRDWDGAEAAISSLLARAPDDGPANMLRERTARLRVHPPPADWDGSYTATDK